MTSSIAVIILTKNEAIHIERAILAAKPFAQEIFVVDSGSTDATERLAANLGAKVFEHPFLNYAAQFQWALDNLPIASDWIMRLDADEVVTNELASELESRIDKLPDEIAGVYLRLGYCFLNRRIRYGGRYPLKLLRVWRKGHAHIEALWMDEHIVLHQGHAITFKNDLWDHNLKDLTFFTEKHNGYATREAVDIILKRFDMDDGAGELSANFRIRQAELKRWIKVHIYNRLPLWFGPLSYFLFRYVLLLGFLDGREGLIYHFLQGFWYRFLVGAKVFEFERALRPLSGRAERLAALTTLSGYDVSAFSRQSAKTATVAGN